MNDLTYQLANMWDIVQVLLVTGLIIGIVVAVIVATARIGFAIAPWLVGIAFLVWMFGGF